MSRRTSGHMYSGVPHRRLVEEFGTASRQEKPKSHSFTAASGPCSSMLSSYNGETQLKGQYCSPHEGDTCACVQCIAWHRRLEAAEQWRRRDQQS